MTLAIVRIIMSSKRNVRRLNFELCEDRRLMATGVTATLVGTSLVVRGTSQADRITLSQEEGVIRVSGVSNTFTASSVRSIVVHAGAGNDLVKVDAEHQIIRARITLNGDAGNDTLIGGRGNEV